MYECLNLFSEPTKAWFKHAFSRPTEVQQQVWPAIHSGENVLVVAPTGSGKTLCAFLSALDRLWRAGRVPQEWMFMAKSRQPRAMRNKKAAGKGSRKKTKRGVKVLYISPLKALGADVAKNLELPCREFPSSMRRWSCPSPISKWPCAAATPHLNNVEESSAIRRIFSSPRRNHYSCCSPPRRTAY